MNRLGSIVSRYSNALFRVWSPVLGMLLAAGGCARNYYAERMVIPDASSGRLCHEVIGTGEQAAKQNRIDLAMNCQRPDGAVIAVWAIKAQAVKGLAPTAVLLHGLGESKANYLGVARRLSAKGLNAVLIDLRAHGCSGGKYITYGAKEKDDVKAVLDELGRKGLKIGDVYAFGTTLGGAVAIQYAAIDPRCKGVMAMAPYRDAASAARRIMVVLAPAMSEHDFAQTLAEAGKLADFNPAEASAVAAAGKLTCPLLLSHGLLDVLVPVDWSGAIFDAAKGPKRFLLITPGPEQLALVMVWEDWLAGRIVELSQGKLNACQLPKAPATNTAR